MASYKGDSREAIRAMQLQKRRQQQQEDIELKKRKIEEENKMTSIDNKFKAHYDAVEQLLRTDTIGLVTLEDMKKKREQLIEQRELQLAKERKAKLEEELERKEKKEKQKFQVRVLSGFFLYYIGINLIGIDYLPTYICIDSKIVVCWRTRRRRR